MSGTQRYAFVETQSGSVSDKWIGKDDSWSPTRTAAPSRTSPYVDSSCSGSYGLVTAEDLIHGRHEQIRTRPPAVAGSLEPGDP